MVAQQTMLTGGKSTSGQPLIASGTSSAVGPVAEDNVDPMDMDHEDLDPDWPPGWDKTRKADVAPIQRPFSQRQWQVFRELLKSLENRLQENEEVGKQKPGTENPVLGIVMKEIADSRLVDLNHPKQDNNVLLKELRPTSLPRMYTRSEEYGVDVGRIHEQEDARLLTQLAKRTNEPLKLRNQSEDFHPSAYQDDDDNDDGAEDDDDVDEDSGDDGGDEAGTPYLVKEEHKKKHAALFDQVHQLFLDCKDAWPPLPQFEQIVGQKKKAGEPTKGVATEKANFLRLHQCADEKEYEKKRLARLPNNSYLMLRHHNYETAKANQATGDPITMGTLPVDEFKRTFTQYHQGELTQADGEAQLKALWTKKQFPAGWARLPPQNDGEYPTLELMAPMATTSPEGSSPAPAPSQTVSSDLASDLASDLPSVGIRASRPDKVSVVLSCRMTTMPALTPDHTDRGQPIKAVVPRKYHGIEFYSFVVEVETNCFQTLPQSACGGPAVAARLSDAMKKTRPSTIDEVLIKMGGSSGEEDEKRQAAYRALGEERGLLWISCEPIPTKPTKMPTMLANLYWKGPHGGSAIVTKTTLSSLIGGTAANALIDACLGRKDDGPLLNSICEKNPQIQPARDLRQKFNALALSAGQASPRKGRGVEGMFRPIVIGYLQAEREVVNIDPDTDMKDAESEEEL